ncbi:MAG: hypothetical protein II347_02130, partial [Lachnospiraceae bacterium]|nr:hypothetical protein [Lachnospiraceae bacterium]
MGQNILTAQCEHLVAVSIFLDHAGTGLILLHAPAGCGVGIVIVILHTDLVALVGLLEGGIFLVTVFYGGNNRVHIR